MSFCLCGPPSLSTKVINTFFTLSYSISKIKDSLSLLSCCYRYIQFSKKWWKIACIKTLSHVLALISATILSCLRNVQRKAVLDEALNCNSVLSDLDFPDLIVFGITGRKISAVLAYGCLLSPLNYSLTFYLLSFVIVVLDTILSEWLSRCHQHKGVRALEGGWSETDTCSRTASRGNIKRQDIIRQWQGKNMNGFSDSNQLRSQRAEMASSVESGTDVTFGERQRGAGTGGSSRGLWQRQTHGECHLCRLWATCEAALKSAIRLIKHFGVWQSSPQLT